MTAERTGGELPEWAQEERERDIAWLKENMLIFQEAAHTAFNAGGRGAIIVDTVEGMGNPFGYYLQSTIDEIADDDTKRIVGEYNPEQEFVIVLLKPGNRVSTYRAQAVERQRKRRRK
jgi:hypothetical protein